MSAWDDWNTQQPQSDQAPTWGDYGKAIGAGAAEIGAGAASAARYFYEAGRSQDGADFWHGVSDLFSKGSEDLTSSMTPEARERLASTVTSDKFWEHPVATSALKLANMSPMVAAAVIPGGIMADATMATVATAAAGGMLNADGVIDEIYKKTDALSDKELQTASDYYAGLRSAGIDEKEARREYNQTLMGLKPALNFALGAAVGAVGPAGELVRGGGAAERGLIGRMASGGARGAAEMGIQSGVADYSAQLAGQQGGLQKDIDTDALAAHVLEGGAFGAAMGAAGGIKKAGGKAAKGDKPSTPIEEADRTPEPDQTNKETTPTAAEVTSPGNAPGGVAGAAPVVAPPEPGAKGKAIVAKAKNKKSKKGNQEANVESVDAGEPTAEQAAAIAATQPEAPRAVPEEVAQAAARVAAQQLPAGPEPARPVPGPAAEPAAAPVANSAEDLGKIGQMGAGIASGLHDRMWGKVQNGDTTDLGRPDAMLQAAKMIRDAGGLQDRATYEAFAQDYGNINRGSNFQAEMRALVQKYAPEPIQPVPQERPVTPEVTPAPAPVAPSQQARAPEAPAPAEPASSSPAGSTRKSGRVLQAIKSKAQEEADAKAAKGAFKQLEKNARTADEVPGESKGKNWTKEEIAQREASAEGAKQIFEHHVPDEAAIPTDKAGREALRQRIGAMLKAAEEAGVKIPAKVGYEGTSDHVVYLRDAADLHRAMGQKSFVGAKRDQRISDFLIGERAAKQGDFSVLRERRKVEGDIAKRKDQGDVENGAPTAAKAKIREKASEGAANEGKVLSGDEKKRAIEELNKRLAAGKVDVAATRTEQPAAKPAAKPTTKVEEIKAKAKKEEPKPEKPPADDADAWLRANDPDYASLNALTDTGVKVKYGSRTVQALHTITAREALKDLNLEHLSGVPKVIADLMRNRLSEVVGDQKIHIVDKKQMADLFGNAGVAFEEDGRGTRGAHLLQTDGRSDVFLRADALRTPQETAHVALHELTHAFTVRAMIEDPKLNITVHHMMEAARDALRRIDKEAAAQYAFTNPREFIAEAFSNPKFQEQLTQIELPKFLARELKAYGGPKVSLWDAFVHVVRKAMAKVLGGDIPQGDRMIEGVLRLGKVFEQRQRELNARAARGEDMWLGSHREAANRLISKDEIKERATDAKTNAAGSLRRIKDKLSSAWMMKERENDTFGPSRPLNRLFDTRAMQEREKDRILNTHGGAEVTRDIARAEREHPEAMAKAKEILFDASLHNINVDGKNDHLGKDDLAGIQAKKQIPRLEKAWADPALDPVRDTVLKAVKFYRDIHNETARETIKNILAEGNIHDAGLADRIFKSGVTEDDREAWKNTKLVDALNEVKALKERKGWYVPFRRYGEFISAAEHELAVPKDALKINDNTIQFHSDSNKTARDAVKAYLEQDSHTSQGNLLTPTDVRKVFVDKNDPTKIIPAEEPDAIPAYRATMQNQHVEFHETEAEAKKNAEGLAEQGLVNARNHKREEAYNNERNLQGAMGTVLRSLEKQQRYIDADPASKAAMRELFHDLTLGLSGTTSIKSSMRARRNVAGQSRDLGRVTADYARMTANHLAKLKFRPKIDAIFKEMRDYIAANKYDKDNLRREEVYQEFNNRIYGREAQIAERVKEGTTKRLLQVSRLARLAGVSFHVINSQEPWTTSLPVIAGRHGIAHTTRQLKDAYNIIGAVRGVVAGVRDTARAFTDDGGFTDYVKLFKDSISRSSAVGGEKARRLQDVIDYMDARNLYGNDSIFEVGKSANPNSNIAGRALDRADLMANQVGSAIEAINRTVTGLAAYNLEYRRNGGNHEAAMHYAYTVAHETMGDYSSWNASPLFNTRGGQLALQFKKFAHKTYYLLGKTMRGAIAGDREAAKQFIGLMVTHGMVAGALGLPLEPFKVALMAANAFGITGFTPDDFDDTVRRLAASSFLGKTGGELVSKGLWRGIGVEVSGRMGLDNLLTYGSPKSQKANDIKAWLFDTMAGAPAGYLLDQVAAAQALLGKGDVATFIEKASPLRAISDVTKAVVGASGPKTNAAGQKTQDTLTPYQAGVRALGFTPSAVSENGAIRGTLARQSRQDSEQRTALMDAWTQAKPSAKLDAWKAVQAYNRGKPRDAQISMSQLTSHASRRQKQGDKPQVGKSSKYIQDRINATYNP